MVAHLLCKQRPTTRYGDLAQLVEHLVCNQKVRGSNPLVSTKHLVRGRFPARGTGLFPYGRPRIRGSRLLAAW